MSFIEGNHESKKDAILFGGAHLFSMYVYLYFLTRSSSITPFQFMPKAKS